MIRQESLRTCLGREVSAAPDHQFECMLKTSQKSLRSIPDIYFEEGPGEPQTFVSYLYWRGDWRHSNPYLRCMLNRSNESLRSLSNIYIEERNYKNLRSYLGSTLKRNQESLRLLIPIQVEEREARRATDLPFRSILKRNQDSLRYLSLLKRRCFDLR